MSSTPSGAERSPEPGDGARGGDLGDLVVVLLGSTLCGLRDRLRTDGFEGPADLVADLVAAVDDYLEAVPGWSDEDRCG
ncbi:MAG TPA: hypothetical protein VHK89_01195 [Actinomycetota bacterium]|nr:hypothetical protein [Actinomycetota bacterium]